MSANRTRCALAVLAFLIVLESRPLAWGPDGHKIVCSIASALLTPADRDEVRRLSRKYTHPDGTHSSSFFTGCTFPDEARSRARNGETGWTRFAMLANWHFLNVPRTTTALPDDCNNCVLEGIRVHAQRFGDASFTDQKRGEGLLFLGHWVGDVHQPLHISFANDQGGNLIELTGSTYASGSLHQVWDSGIITKARGNDDWWTYAQTLASQITPAMRTEWLAEGAQSWAQQSYDITIGEATQYCALKQGACRSISGKRNLMAAYQTLFQPKVELRLQQAGVRLANVISRALHP